MHNHTRYADVRIGLIALTAVAIQACRAEVTAPEADRSGSPSTAESIISCPGPEERMKVLVDASHGGGVWWFPQSGSFDPDEPHQGRDLAQRLRHFGFQVDEAPRDGHVPLSRMNSYGVVIRVGNFGAYTESEVEAYERYATCGSTLVILGEYLRDGETDPIAEGLGVEFAGTIRGYVSDFDIHPLTDGVTTFEYIAGSYIESAGSDVELLGRVDGEPVMAVLESDRARAVFLGDANGVQLVPQPFTDNLITWLLPE